MLIIKRKAQDIITISPVEGMDTSLPISEIFGHGPIEIKLLEVGRRQVKVAIDAPPLLQIWRGRKDTANSPADEPAAQAAGEPLSEPVVDAVAGGID
ncbi:MAG: carbon storage regulator [Woeseia sp.]